MEIRLATEADIDAIAAIASSAFHPDTDAITRRLFPTHLQAANSTPASTAGAWRYARKTTKLTDPRISITVAVGDDSQVVGFSLWEIPARGTHGGAVLSSSVQCPGLDQTAFDEMQQVLRDDVQKIFGDRGTDHVWRR